jgi:asparagine synthase (glutamine-hydrolysing)
MCGFIVVGANELMDVQIKKNIENSDLIHRGPDSQNFLEISKSFFGKFSRLSVVDDDHLSMQPMSSSCGRFHLFFNGEIYNYKKLQKKYSIDIRELKTQSDTEVLLRLLILRGEKILAELDGMFSFVLYDQIKNNIFVARDRWGIKPLYYRKLKYKNVDYIYFASEIGVISKAIPKKPCINESKIDEYLRYKYLFGYEALIQDIMEFPPAHYCVIDLRNLDISFRKYFNLYRDDDKKYGKYSESEGGDIVRSLLEESIEDQLVANAEIGLMLSGGVDSSLIASLASKCNNWSKKVFSVSMGNVNDPYNEIKYAQYVAQKYSYEQRILQFNFETYASNLKATSKYHDTPINHPHAVAIYGLANIASSEVKVLLSGEGSDEFFMGYGRYQDNNTKDIHKNGVFLRTDKDMTTLAEVYLGKRNEEIDRINFINALTKNCTPIEILRYYEISGHLRDLLKRLDVMTMGAGIEGRVPFLSNALTNFALILPASKLVKNGGKRPIKNALRNEFEESFIYRSKGGFQVPLNSWIANENMSKIFDHLEFYRDSQLFNYKKILQILSELKLGINIESNSKFFSLLLHLKLWCESHQIDMV